MSICVYDVQAFIITLNDRRTQAGRIYVMYDTQTTNNYFCWFIVR